MWYNGFSLYISGWNFKLGECVNILTLTWVRGAVIDELWLCVQVLLILNLCLHLFIWLMHITLKGQNISYIILDHNIWTRESLKVKLYLSLIVHQAISNLINFHYISFYFKWLILTYFLTIFINFA